MSINVFHLEADGITIEASADDKGEVSLKIHSGSDREMAETHYLSPLSAKLFGMALQGLSEPQDP